jgi:uncharacterized membrane protein YeaQ/YmgE (transglycosylase-associated protein family)
MEPSRGNLVSGAVFENFISDCGDISMRIDPALAFLLIILIGIAAGIIFDRFAGPGWLTRQVAGSTRGIVTSSLVGIAGAFIGFHIAALLAISTAGGYFPFLLAAVGAALVLWLWRIMR